MLTASKSQGERKTGKDKGKVRPLSSLRLLPKVVLTMRILLCFTAPEVKSYYESAGFFFFCICWVASGLLRLGGTSDKLVLF